MFKKFGKISFDLSFIIMIGFTLASLVFTFMSLFITNMTTWDSFFEALGMVFSVIVLNPPFITGVFFLVLLIAGLLFKDKIYSFITEKGKIYKTITDTFSVIVYTTALGMGFCAIVAQVIYFFESFNGLNYVFETMGVGGDATLAGTFMLGFRIATWVLHLAVIAIVGFFIGLTIYKFVKYVKSSKKESVSANTVDSCKCDCTDESCEENQ